MRNRVVKAEVDNYITVDLPHLCAMLNTGRWTAERIAEEAGASIKIGNRRLYIVAKIQAYLNSISGVETR